MDGRPQTADAEVDALLGALLLDVQDTVDAQNNASGDSWDDDTGCDGIWQCAICLENIAFIDLATVKDCDHTYCATCILQWAASRSEPCCPTCKKPFQQLLVHRDLDGTVSDAPIPETIAFLLRTPWYQTWSKEQSHISELTRQHSSLRSVAVAEGPRSAFAIAQEDWADEAMYTYFEDMYEDDDIEEYYLRPGTRLTLGNRPFGPNGYVRGGRRRAAPVKQPQTGKKTGSSVGSSKDSKGASTSGTSTSSAPARTGGRRSQRKAKRAEAQRHQEVNSGD